MLVFIQGTLSKNRTVIVTGGAGFIGSSVIGQYISNTQHTIINVDVLTYAGNLDCIDFNLTRIGGGSLILKKGEIYWRAIN